MGWWTALLLGTSLAHAESFYLESEPVATRAEAEAVASAAADGACAGTVIRRYVKGLGWRYVFRSTAVAEAGGVQACLDALALPDGVALRIVEREGERARVMEVGPEGVAPAPAEARAEEPPGIGVEDVVSRLVRAHTGGADRTGEGGATGLGGTDAVLFRFERQQPGRRIVHTYARRGDDVYLEIQVLEGEGQSSRAGISGGVPWLEGSTDSLDVATVREQLSRFDPDHVLGLAAELARGVLDVPDRDLLYVMGARDADDVHEVDIGAEGERDVAPLRLTIDSRTWRLLAYERGAPGSVVRWTWQGWRETEAGSLRPSVVSIRRGDTLLDRIEVVELELSPTLPDEWFTPPGT